MISPQTAGGGFATMAVMTNAAYPRRATRADALTRLKDILVFEPQAAMRITLCSFLEMTFPHSRIATAQTAESALELSSRWHPQLGLINVDVPNHDNAALLENIRALVPDAILIATSTRAPDILEATLLAAGADTVVHTDRIWDELIPAVTRSIGH